MPTITKPAISITYSVADMEKLMLDDLFQNHGYEANVKDVVPIISGGYKDCDCATWGGPRVGECNCPYIPAKFVGFKISVKQ